MKIEQEPHIEFAILAVDIVIFTVRDGKLLMRMMNVDRPPYFKNIPGFPGGLIQPKETAEDTALRIIREKANISSEKVYLEQLYTFSKVDRDPRGRVVSVGYIALVPWEELSDEEKNGNTEIWWEEKRSIKNLAYDHNFVFEKAISHLHFIVRNTTAIFKLLPSQFTLTMIETMLENVLDEHIDKRNFRKKIEKLNLLKTLKEKTSGAKHRPAQLYSVKSNAVKEIGIL